MLQRLYYQADSSKKEQNTKWEISGGDNSLHRGRSQMIVYYTFPFQLQERHFGTFAHPLPVDDSLHTVREYGILLPITNSVILSILTILNKTM